MSATPIGPRASATALETQPNSATAKTGGAREAVVNAHDTIAPSAKGREPALRDAARALAASPHPTSAARQSALIDALLAHVPQADRAAAKTAIPAILEAARKGGSNDPNRIGYLLATAQTESDFGANMTERGHSPRWFNAKYGCEDGNRPGTDDGFRYRGRGYVQTTHAGRYAELSHRLGLPDVPSRDAGTSGMEPALVAHPERLTEPKLAAKALVTGVVQNLFTHNPKAAIDTTIPIGRPPGKVDFYHARAIVNGIVKDQAQTIARHATVYAEVLDGYRHSVLGLPDSK